MLAINQGLSLGLLKPETPWVLCNGLVETCALHHPVCLPL